MRLTISRASCVGAALLLACGEPRSKGAESPGSEADRRGSPECSAGGPSVSINIRGRHGGQGLAADELGTLLAWIGGFAQPCREATPEAPFFTLAIHLDESDQPPTFDLIDRATLPGLAACLDESFAKAPPPPAESMTVAIVIPWGCPTLGAGFQPGYTEPSP